MKHTKGKLKLIEKNQTLTLVAVLPDGSEFLVLPDWEISSDESVGIFCDAELERANFRRIVQCWNSHDDLLAACKRFVEGWSHFCKCIDFGQSALDAEAIRFMNEVPGEIEQAAKATQDAPEQK